MIISKEPDIFTQNSSSKGNQLKWRIGQEWFKVDGLGYESLSEVVISGLLKKSTVTDYVEYEYETVLYGNVSYHACKSVHFLEKGEEFYTLNQLYWQYKGKSLYRLVWELPEEKRLSFLVDEIIKLTNLADFGKYMTMLLEIDAIFLNEDRHLHNIAIIRKQDGTFRTSPVFDQGAALLSDIREYPVDGDIWNLIDNVKGKTFHSSTTNN